jgi:hypothetical protein
MPQNRGVQISDLGLAAFELGRLERRDELPEPVEYPVIVTRRRRKYEARGSK